MGAYAFIWLYSFYSQKANTRDKEIKEKKVLKRWNVLKVKNERTSNRYQSSAEMGTYALIVYFYLRTHSLHPSHENKIIIKYLKDATYKTRIKNEEVANK